MSYGSAEDAYKEKITTVRSTLEGLYEEVKKTQEGCARNGAALSELGACALGVKQIAENIRGHVAVAQGHRAEAEGIIGSDAIISPDHPDMQDGRSNIADVSSNLMVVDTDYSWVIDAAEYEAGSLAGNGDKYTERAGQLATLQGSLESAYRAATQAAGPSA